VSVEQSRAESWGGVDKLLRKRSGCLPLRSMTFLTGLLVLCAACSRPPVKEQPLKYSHKAHVSNGLPCELCHETVATQAFAGIPSIDSCMTCHQGKITDSPEEEKLRKIAASGGSLDWQPILLLPTHVYFSHRRHVTLVSIECRTCHGGMQDTTAPPDSPPIKITMKFCIRCHEERKASVDCISCHE